MHPIVWILLILVFSGIAGVAGYMYRKDMVEKKINRSEETARRLYDDAVRKADDYKKEKVFEAKEEILKARAAMDAEKAENDREMRDRRSEIQRSENRLMQREASLDKRSDSLDNRESDLKKRSDNLDRKEEEVDRLQEEAEQLHQKQTTELERIAAMTQDEAKQIIIERVQKEAFHDAAAQVRDIEARAKEEAEKKARNIIALAIQKCAADHVAESTVSVIALPNDDMKGRIIGREGRNIRALETATGVDLIIDDTPEAVIVSAFDPVRREIARLTVEKLINDGRIHPARIEETVEKAKKEVENQIREAGESAVFETNQHGIHHELVKLLGRLKYRTSYGQNVLKHAIEVSHLAGLMAAELGA
ncbi:MAG: ribonuclease Y, partial [Clostridia bacterium]|nr:ribonuclease Y [Clostridia bacterium]